MTQCVPCCVACVCMQIPSTLAGAPSGSTDGSRNVTGAKQCGLGLPIPRFIQRQSSTSTAAATAGLGCAATKHLAQASASVRKPSSLCCLCRYLVCGSDSASLYLEVLSVDDQDIVCEAKNGAVMDGLMTVSTAEHSRTGDMSFQVTSQCSTHCAVCPVCSCMQSACLLNVVSNKQQVYAHACALVVCRCSTWSAPATACSTCRTHCHCSGAQAAGIRSHLCGILEQLGSSNLSFLTAPIVSASFLRTVVQCRTPACLHRCTLLQRLGHCP